VARRTRLAPEARREQLLEVARALFEVHAYDDVSLESIAEAANVSPALLHHYFGSKRDVFMAVVARAIDGFQAAVSPAYGAGPPGSGDPTTNLRAAIERYLDFVLVRPNGYAFVIGARGAPDAEVRAMIDAARQAVHLAVLGIVGLPQPTCEQDLMMWGWLGFVEHATTRWVEQGGGDREELVELLLMAAVPALGA
jgi:AcrR family transcriptional regulator